MKIRHSIKVNTIISTIIFMSILTLAITSIGIRLFSDSVMERYVTYARTVLELSYRACDEYDFGDMIAAREMKGEYEGLRAELNLIKESSDIEYLYAIYFEDIDDLSSAHYAINAKASWELEAGAQYTYMGTPCEEGSFTESTLAEFQRALKEKHRFSETLEGDSDKYGHMLNGYRVLYDKNDNAVGLLCVEIDVIKILFGVVDYVRTVLLVAFIISIAVIFLYILRTDRDLINPILQISRSSDSFVKKMQANSAPEDLKYEDNCRAAKGEIRLLSDNVKSLAEGVSSYMTNLSAATAEKERIGTELELAQKIQASTLPNDFPPFPGRTEFDIYATMDPAKEVGGDFYDFFLIDDDHLGLVMADVSGKGVPAALFMMISKMLVNNFAMMGFSPAKVLEMTNDKICSNNEQDMFVTVWFGILEISTGRVVAANAGHEYPMIRKADGDFELFNDKHGFVIGGMEGVHYREYEFTLDKGGTLFLYTDGVPEATREDNELFGTDRMLEALNLEPDASPKELLENMKKAADDFDGDAPQFDDMTMMGVKLY